MIFTNRIKELKELVRSSPYRCTVAQATAHSKLTHPSCGDEIIFSARIYDGKIIEIGVLGNGCLLSQSAGVLAAEYAHGRPLTDLAHLSDGILIDALNIGPVGPTRQQCISMAVEALKQLSH